MRLISYIRSGKAGFGIVSEEGVIDLTSRLGLDNTLRDFVTPAGLDTIRTHEHTSPDFGLDEVELLPPIPNPDKILCVGLNYKTHVVEAKVEVPRFPIIFLRTRGSQVGHGAAIIRPAVSDTLDFEGELVVVIGKGGRHIASEQAYDHVAGYTCYNDGSVREFQRHTSQWGPGKNFAASGGCGPWLATADSVPPPSEFTLMTRVNGEEMQHAPVSDLLFDIPTLIAYCSTFAELEPGDLIVTGTTGGVGTARTPPLYLKAGDVVEVEVSPVGVLRNIVEDECR